MDIWDWVHDATESLRKNGQARLADLVDEVSSACCDGEHERVENMVPEALSLARAAKHPWLEVFIRHWLLQSRVLHRHDVSRDTMKQAVSLLELASRPETRDCPQSVCAVQDLASAYGLVDGVGFAEQRLAVTEEALGRINPSWPCFDCVSSERAGALLDLGRHAEALELCDRQLAQHPTSTTGLQGNRFRALSALGRHREALRVAENIDLERSGESGAVTNALYRALAYARLGQFADALGVLPAFPRLEPEHYLDWLRCAQALGPAEGHPNSWKVERALASMSRTLEQYESHFTLAQVHKKGAELAVQRGARGSAERHLQAARRTAAHLREPTWLLEKLALVEADVRRLATAPRYETVEAALQALGNDPEVDLAIIEGSALPVDARLEHTAVRALTALGAESEARQRLEATCQLFPDDLALLEQLLTLLRRAGEHERLRALCESRTGAGYVEARWAWAQSAEQHGDPASARSRCLEVLARAPEHVDARLLLAKLEREAGELDAALATLEPLVGEGEPGVADWDRLLVATLAGRWDLVRSSAARLELPVEPGEGPIDERWGGCRIRVTLADGRDVALFAWRTGPVTARIDHVLSPSLPQRHGDLVAFDAEPLNLDGVTAARQAGDDSALFEYAAVRTLKPGNFRAFAIDGFLPDDEDFEQLKERIGRVGIVWEQRSDDEYVLTLDGEERPATYAFLGVPESCSDAEAHAAVSGAVGVLGLSLVWLELARAAGDDATADVQQRLADAWGIE
jgi:tetratricopeptide (TPR) repeat protein